LDALQDKAFELGFDKDQVTVADSCRRGICPKHGKLGALRSWMDTTWHPSTIDTAKSQIHNLILDLEFPIIYTTNYDPWLELAFEARQTVSSAQAIVLRSRGIEPILGQQADPKKPARTFLEELMRRVKASHE
jgi:hypothetical protein